MGWLANTLVGVAVSVGLMTPNTISYVAPPPLTIEEKILKELPPVFIEIAREESRMGADPYNPEWHKGCQGSYGLFQIACLHYEGDPKDLYDNDLNIQLAKKVYETQGFDAWRNTCKKIKCYE